MRSLRTCFETLPAGVPPDAGRHRQQELVKKHLREALQTVQAMLLAGETNPFDMVAELAAVRDRLALALELIEQST